MEEAPPPKNPFSPVKIWGGRGISASGVSPKRVKSRRCRRKKKEEEEKNRWKQWPASLPSATMGGTQKPPGPKVCVNNGQLHLGTLPRVARANCQDQLGCLWQITTEIFVVAKGAMLSQPSCIDWVENFEDAFAHKCPQMFSCIYFIFHLKLKNQNSAS